jgi:hypothetical protein
MHYNFGALANRFGSKTTPAMVSGITDHVWMLAEVVGMLDQTPAVKL